MKVVLPLLLLSVAASSVRAVELRVLAEGGKPTPAGGVFEAASLLRASVSANGWTVFPASVSEGLFAQAIWLDGEDVPLVRTGDVVAGPPDATLQSIDRLGRVFENASFGFTGNVQGDGSGPTLFWYDAPKQEVVAVDWQGWNPHAELAGHIEFDAWSAAPDGTVAFVTDAVEDTFWLFHGGARTLERVVGTGDPMPHVAGATVTSLRLVGMQKTKGAVLEIGWHSDGSGLSIVRVSTDGVVDVPLSEGMPLEGGVISMVGALPVDPDNDALLAELSVDLEVGDDEGFVWRNGAVVPMSSVYRLQGSTSHVIPTALALSGPAGRLVGEVQEVLGEDLLQHVVIEGADGLRSVATAGEPAPGWDDLTFDGFANVHLIGPDLVAFVGLTDEGFGVWRETAPGQLELLFRENDPSLGERFGQSVINGGLATQYAPHARAAGLEGTLVVNAIFANRSRVLLTTAPGGVGPTQSTVSLEGPETLSRNQPRELAAKVKLSNLATDLPLTIEWQFSPRVVLPPPEELEGCTVETSEGYLASSLRCPLGRARASEFSVPLRVAASDDQPVRVEVTVTPNDEAPAEASRSWTVDSEPADLRLECGASGCEISNEGPGSTVASITVSGEGYRLVDCAEQQRCFVGLLEPGKGTHIFISFTGKYYDLVVTAHGSASDPTPGDRVHLKRDGGCTSVRGTGPALLALLLFAARRRR